MPNNVKTINVSKQTYFPPDGENYKTRWTYMSLMRCALTKILPRNKKVLWLDCDTIVNGDISELFETDLTGMYYAGVREPEKCNNGRTYINAGVLLINLEQIRKDRFEDVLIKTLNTERLPLPDQDAINNLAQGKIKAVHGRFNASPFTEQTFEKTIYHYAANIYFYTEKLFIKYNDERWLKK